VPVGIGYPHPTGLNPDLPGVFLRGGNAQMIELHGRPPIFEEKRAK